MKAVIFDRDGIIIDSESTNVNSVTQAFEQLGITIKENEKDWIIGRHPDEYTDTFSQKYNFPQGKFREIQRKLYYELLESTPIFDKTIRLIKLLHASNIPLALTTSSGKDSTLQILKKADIENIFQVIVTAEDYAEKKPDPESYLLTAKKLNIPPEECVVIEDSSVGVQAAKAANMKCIAIPNKYTQNQNLSTADLIVNSIDKIDIALLSNI